MRIGILGCGGRMGQAVLREVLRSADAELAGGVEREGHPLIGRDLGQLGGGDPFGRRLESDVPALLERADAVIEFTAPSATLEHARLSADAGCAHIIGTTGFCEAQLDAIRHAAERTAVVLAPNMSLGVNLLVALVERVARALGDEFDIEILEMHHRHKVDAPSGTALALARAAAHGRNVVLEDAMVRARDGITGERQRGSIGMAVLRGGDVVGEHAVNFAGEGERVVLSHYASSREIFARGAVHAALWAGAAPPGFYSMADVLGLTDG